MSHLIPARPRVGAATVALALALGLAACSPSSPEAADPTTPAPDVSASVEPQQTEEPAAAGFEPAVSSSEGLVSPDWAYQAVNFEDELGTVQLGPLSVRFSDAGRAPASRDRVRSDGTKALVAGEPMSFVSWTVTNTGDEPVRLTHSLVSVSFSHDGWSLSVVDSHTETWERIGVPRHVIDSSGGAPYLLLAPGESFTDAQNYPQREVDVLDVRLAWTPAGDEGDLRHEEKIEERFSLDVT